MASAVARAYEGLGTEPQRGSRGQSPRWGVRGQSPLEADEVFVFKTVIFNASAAVFHEMIYCLSCFFCAQVYGFTVSICSLAIKLKQNDSWVDKIHSRNSAGAIVSAPLPNLYTLYVLGPGNVLVHKSSSIEQYLRATGNLCMFTAVIYTYEFTSVSALETHEP